MINQILTKKSPNHRPKQNLKIRTLKTMGTESPKKKRRTMVMAMRMNPKKKKRKKTIRRKMTVMVARMAKKPKKRPLLSAHFIAPTSSN